MTQLFTNFKFIKGSFSTFIQCGRHRYDVGKKKMERTNKKKGNQLVSEFFKGRSVFLTGASGFVGMVILETLLRCCPGIASVYILLRSKGNLSPEQRKELIFQKKVFTVLKKKNPEILEKVHVVAGDISKPGFGITEKDLRPITEEVSIVYHCAASIKLMAPVRYTIQLNSSSTSTIIDLCRMMKKFCVLVYTSTSYSNCNHVGLPIKEEVYTLPVPTHKILNALKKSTDDELLELVSLCKPDWPSWYPFSKCLSENILKDMASDLSVAIIRPSLVGSAWKNPIPGYTDENSGFAIIVSTVGDNFIKVIHGDGNIKVNIVPVDVIANAHLIAAWSIGSKKVSSPLVVNCTSVGYLHSKWTEQFNILKRVSEDCLQKFSQNNKKLMILRKRCLYWIANVYEHYIPAIITDMLLLIKGQKPRMFATYYFLHRFFYNMGTIQLNSSDYETNNLDYLNDLLRDEDKKNFYNNTQNLTLEEFFKQAIQEIQPPSWKKDQKIMIQYDRLISFLQCIALVFCCCTVYWMIIVVCQQFQLIYL